MQNNKYKIRTMNRKEVEIAVEWAAKEGWNPGIYDADCFIQRIQMAFLLDFWETNQLLQFLRSNTVSLLVYWILHC